MKVLDALIIMLKDTQLLGIFIGWTLNEIANYFRRKSDQKNSVLMNLIPLRNQAYTEIFSELNKLYDYFDLFIEESEFKETRSIDEFGPLMSITNFQKKYSELAIYFDKDISLEISKFLSNIMVGNTLALNRITVPELVDEQMIASLCIDTLVQIDNLKERIRVCMGLYNMEKMIKSFG